MSHVCHAEGCSAPVRPSMFACGRHWGMVGPVLQRQLLDVYVPGQEDTKTPTLIYVVVQTRCRIAIAGREGRAIASLCMELRQWLMNAKKGMSEEAITRIAETPDDLLIKYVDTLLPRWIGEYRVKTGRVGA